MFHSISLTIQKPKNHPVQDDIRTAIRNATGPRAKLFIPEAGNGNHIPPVKDGDWGLDYDWFTHMNEGIYGHISDKDWLFEMDMFSPQRPMYESSGFIKTWLVFPKIDDEISISMRKTMAPKRFCPKMDGCIYRTTES